MVFFMGLTWLTNTNDYGVRSWKSWVLVVPTLNSAVAGPEHMKNVSQQTGATKHGALSNGITDKNAFRRHHAKTTW